MPRAGTETPAPAAPQGADAGTGAALRRMAQAVPATPPPDATNPTGAQSTPPSSPGAGAGTSPVGDVAQPSDLNAGYDAALFGPTDRPGEPVTQGLPFGPGASYVPRPNEDDRTFLLRVADQLENTPGASGPLRQFIDKIRLGG